MHAGESFWRGADLDDATILRQQQIAAAQHLAALEDDAHLFAPEQMSAKAAAASKIERQHQPGVWWGRDRQAPRDRHHIRLLRILRTGNSAAPAAVRWPARKSAADRQLVLHR